LAGAVPPRPVVCTLPLITKANQSLPIAYRPSLGSRNSLECSGSDEPIRTGSRVNETRSMSSRTPAPLRALLQLITGLKFPDVLGLHVTPVAIASQCAKVCRYLERRRRCYFAHSLASLPARSAFRLRRQQLVCPSFRLHPRLKPVAFFTGPLCRLCRLPRLPFRSVRSLGINASTGFATVRSTFRNRPIFVRSPQPFH